MKITKLVSHILESNTYVVEKGDEVVIIDCGCEFEMVKQVVGEKKVIAILLTHGHYDHALYCNEYAQQFNCKIFANENIKITLSNPETFYSEDESGIDDISNFIFIREDCKLKLGEFDINCYSFPGHSPCCEGYVIENNLFAGDFLFAKSFGRVDLINSNKADMLESFEKIRDVDFKNMYSGHGEESTKEEQLTHFKLFRKFLER